ncbi:hypothetical protein M885DRAFT_516426 [Pelagophyceae sp. CCMP2097]|nr:hypothetical protein M885DRAFT_516426 [Pelagophyceae sp. CCMP2097]|mmetsp:Transcript_28874/g.99510  ORF Transcript_28874/g.99510 Transcript_28874/m.99510 type:complete len:132 (+) Transcript_28874:64-459(+)
MATAGTYPTDLCGCCSVKDCGFGCCLKIYCCLPCNYGSAIEAAGLGPCCPCCCAAYSPLVCCAVCYNRGKLAEKYNIDEGGCAACMKTVFCTCCVMLQDVNLILVKENKTWGCLGVAVDGGAPAAADAMAR